MSRSPQSNFDASMQAMETRLSKAIEEAMIYKAAFDDLCAEMKGGNHRVAPIERSPVSKALRSNKPLIERLITFCHPDRHQNSEISNELTKVLLRIRDVP